MAQRSSCRRCYEAAVAALGARARSARSIRGARGALLRSVGAHADGGGAGERAWRDSGRSTNCVCRQPARAALAYREAYEASPLGQPLRLGGAARDCGSTAARAATVPPLAALGARTSDKRLALGYRTLAALRDEISASVTIGAPVVAALSRRRRLAAVGSRRRRRRRAHLVARARLRHDGQGAAARRSRRARVAVRLGVRRARCSRSRRPACSIASGARVTRRSRTSRPAMRSPISCRCCAASVASRAPTSSGRPSPPCSRTKPRSPPTARIAPARSWPPRRSRCRS